MGRPYRIAVVEDDIDLLNTTVEFLFQSGYEVWGVGSAEAFFRQFAANPADLVVLDIGLPGEDGLSVARLLKDNPRVAVVIVSARDALDDRIAGLRAGADRYLVKPVDLSELAANIDVAVIRTRQADTAAAAPQKLSAPFTKEITGWTLDGENWILRAPGRGGCKLTSREYALLSELMSANGEPVSKKALASRLFGSRTVNGVERLNVLIARLRKKATEILGLELPIKTVHLVGYAFTAPCTLL